MPRDSEKTKQKILEALAGLLAESGFEGVGVNAVARRAGVDKVLIYRYFGGLPQLLQEYAKGREFWPDWPQLVGRPEEELAGMDLREFSQAALRGHLRELRKRPLTQEIMRWELLARNELTDGLARAREETVGRMLELMGRRGEEPEMVELLAAAAVLHAGITYLALRAKTADLYMGVDLTGLAGWERIARAVENLTGAYFDRLEEKGPTREEGKDEP